jgi:hypothetical protein
MRADLAAGLIAWVSVAAPLPLAGQEPAAPAPAEKPADAPKKEKDPRGEWLERMLEQFNKKKGAPAPGGPAAPEGEEDDEKRADPIKTLEEAARLMSEAEEYLYAASARKGLAVGTRAASKLDPPGIRPPNTPDGQPPKSPDGGGKALDTMKLAQEKIEKLLGDADQKQKDTIDLINLLIRQARQVEQQSQQQQQHRQQQQQQRQQQQQQQNQPNATRPADRPYTPPPSREGTAPPRTADRADRWGDLPPHLREETNQGMRQVEEFPAEYRELLQEYYKRLSGGD